MIRSSDSEFVRMAVLVLASFVTLGIGMALVAAAITARVGFVGWLVIVAVPVTVLCYGLCLLSGHVPRWYRHLGSQT